jgi:hypothetical protein
LNRKCRSTIPETSIPTNATRIETSDVKIPAEDALLKKFPDPWIKYAGIIECVTAVKVFVITPNKSTEA